MKKHTMKKIPFCKTIYVRILLVVILSWVMIVLITGLLSRIALNRFSEEPLIASNLRNYSDYIISQIENGDTESVVGLYRDKYGISITVIENGEVISGGKVPKVPRHVLEVMGRFRNPFKFRHHFYYINKRGNRLYIFTHERHRPFVSRIFFVFAAAAFLTCAAVLLIFRKLLRPLYVLHDGMRKVAGGDIEHRIEIKSADEFGMLSRAFNEMNSTVFKMMKAKDRILLDISHEFKSPLARIMLALEIDDIEKLRGSVGRDTMHLSEMVSSILERYRSSSNIELKPEKVPLFSIVGDVLSMVKNGRVVFTYTEDEVLCDTERTGILVKNLVENALFYSEGTVEVKIEKDMDSLVLTVKDSGGGISPEDLPYIFEPFYRADRSRASSTGGTGLGLFICKNIAEAHGWHISVESAGGKGTTVTVSGISQVR